MKQETQSAEQIAEVQSNNSLTTSSHNSGRVSFRHIRSHSMGTAHDLAESSLSLDTPEELRIDQMNIEELRAEVCKLRGERVELVQSMEAEQEALFNRLTRGALMTKNGALNYGHNFAPTPPHSRHSSDHDGAKAENTALPTSVTKRHSRRVSVVLYPSAEDSLSSKLLSSETPCKNCAFARDTHHGLFCSSHSHSSPELAVLPLNTDVIIDSLTQQMASIHCKSRAREAELMRVIDGLRKQIIRLQMEHEEQDEDGGGMSDDQQTKTERCTSPIDDLVFAPRSL